MYDTILKGPLLWNSLRTRDFVLIYFAEVICVVIIGLILDWIYDRSIGKLIKKITKRIPKEYNILKKLS